MEEKKEELKLNRKKKLNIVCIILLLIFAFSCSNIELENDTFFDLSVAKSLITDGFYNIENTTIHENLHYNSIHWLFEVVIYFINSSYGYIGLYNFEVLIIEILTFCIYRALNKQNFPIIISFITTAWTVYFISDIFTVRAQIVMFLFWFLASYCLERLVENGKNKYIIYCALCFLVIANVQAYTFVISLSLFFPYFVEKFFSRKCEGTKEGIKFIYINRNINKIIIAFILSGFIGLINPYGISIYYEPFVVIHGYAKKMVSELQYGGFVNSVMLVATLIFYVICISCPKQKITIRDFTSFAMFTIATIYAIKFAPFLMIATVFSTARMMEYFVKTSDMSLYENMSNQYNYSRSFYIFMSMFFIAFSFYLGEKVFLEQEFVSESFYPVEATEWLKENVNPEEARIFVFPNYGSYLEYNGYKVSWDTRNEMYENNDIEKSYEADLYYFYENKISYRYLLEKYDANYIVYKKYEKAYCYMVEDENLKLDYEDDNFVIFEVIK